MTRNASEERPVYDDEISLVDLATTLIRRRRVFYVVFGGTVVLALIYAFFIMGELRQYATLVRLGEDEGKPLESPAAVIANIESHWYPELLGRYRAESNDKLPFEIAASNPENTHLVKLVSEASPDKAGEVEAKHRILVDQINARQSELLARQKQELEQRVASAKDYLAELSDMEATGEAQAELIQQRARMLSEIESLTTRIAKLEPAETVVVAREGVNNEGISKSLVLVLSVLLGGMLGIFAAFIGEFIVHVQGALKEKS